MVDLSLLQDFIAETTEYLEDMEGCLLRLEADPGNRMILDDIFRSVHTIKGAAEYLGIEKITELSRAIENLLYHQLHHSRQECGPEVRNLLISGRERLGQLMRNLEQEDDKEPVSIDDLIESIRVVDTSSRISEEVRKVTADEDENDLSAESAAGRLDFPEEEEDEYDEELYTIFLEQLEEKLNQINLQVAALANADHPQLPGILDTCLCLIETLRGAANYMGYEQLTSFYDLWISDLKSARQSVAANDGAVTAAEIAEAMAGNIAALVNRYPRLNLDPTGAGSASGPATGPARVDGTGQSPDSVSGDAEKPNQEQEDGDLSGDILDEYAATTSPTTPPAADNRETEEQKDNNLFERLSWSFDNRIRQSRVEPVEEDLVEIESELFSAPDRQSPPPSATRPEVTPSTAPEVAATAPKKSAGAADIMAIRDDYREENDTEQFIIFQELIEEVLNTLLNLAGNLQGTENRNRDTILELCRQQIERLHSAASYMGYEHQLSFYEGWLDEISAAAARLQNGEEDFLEQFITDSLATKIESLARMFPDISLSDRPQPGASTDPAAEKAPAEPAAETAGEPAATKTTPAVTADGALLTDFTAETREHLEEMEEHLLQLDSDASKREVLDDIFRSVHTIKGAAEYLGIERISSLTHNLENLLYQLRQDKIKISREVIDLLMAGWDRISLLVENLEEKRAEEAGIEDLLERIRIIDQGGKTTLRPPRPVTAPAKAQSGAETASGTGPEKTPSRPAETAPEKSVKRSIRVEAGKIDALMNQVGELVVSRAGFTQILGEMQNLQHELKQNLKLDIRELRQLTGMTTRLSETTTLFEKVINELQGEVMKVRMLPISQLFNRYPRLVYDLVRNTGKLVKLDIEGAETELDKMVIEEISDPLIHIIRNAVDHGIETTEERRRKGKPETGTIKLKAYHEGNHVIIEIVDDGRGLDLELIKQKAVAGNFVNPADLAQMSTREITGLIMKPGFSTAAKVTHISGRGVGMDVVRKNIEKLNGTIEINTTPGIETHFRIKIPLTLAIIPALRVRVAGELFTIPLSTVEETLKTTWDQVFTIEDIEVLSFRESTLPLIRMADLFNLKRERGNHNRPSQAYIVVVSTGMKRMGLVVDELLGQENVVIKPLEDYIQEKSGFSGATILGDGRISLILDVYELINLAISQRGRKRTHRLTITREPEPVSP